MSNRNGILFYRYYYQIVTFSLFIGLLLVLLGSDIHAAKKNVFDPWKLDPFIEGDEVPPEDMVILIKLASVAPKGSAVIGVHDGEVLRDIMKATNGLVKYKIWHGGVMGDEADLVRKIKMKQIHSTALTRWGSIVPSMRILQLPFLFDWEPELYYNEKYCARDFLIEKFAPSIRKFMAAEANYQYQGMLEGAFSGFATQIPMKTVADLHALRFPAIGTDPFVLEVNKKIFGMKKSMYVEFYDVLPMMSTGMLDSFWTATAVLINLQVWPHVKYLTDYPVYGWFPATCIIEKDVFERIMAFVDKWGTKYGLKDGKDLARRWLEIYDTGLAKGSFLVRRLEKEAREGLIQRGIKEVPFQREELEKLRKKAEAFYDQMAGKYYPRALLDEILVYREEYRQLKAEGKLEEFPETGILPGGNQFNEWRTQWGKGIDQR